MQNKSRRFNHKRGNLTDFGHMISNCTNLVQDDPNGSYNSLVDVYSLAQERFIPKTNLSNYSCLKGPKWFTNEIKKTTNNKYKVYCQMRASGYDLELRIKYRAACKVVRKKKQTAIIKYETK